MSGPGDERFWSGTGWIALLARLEAGEHLAEAEEERLLRSAWSGLEGADAGRVSRILRVLRALGYEEGRPLGSGAEEILTRLLVRQVRALGERWEFEENLNAVGVEQILASQRTLSPAALQGLYERARQQLTERSRASAPLERLIAHPAASEEVWRRVLEDFGHRFAPAVARRREARLLPEFRALLLALGGREVAERLCRDEADDLGECLRVLGGLDEAALQRALERLRPAQVARLGREGLLPFLRHPREGMRLAALRALGRRAAEPPTRPTRRKR